MITHRASLFRVIAVGCIVACHSGQDAAGGDAGGDTDAISDGGIDAPPPPVVATGYFVDCDQGDDHADGTSFATPWRTLAKVNATVHTVGADVWIKAGTTCEDQTLTVDWSGSEADRVIIGSYYVTGGVAYQGYVDSTRAEINGTYEPACRQRPAKCAWNTSSSGTDKTGTGAVPANRYGSLVTINMQKYVTVQDLTLRDSAGLGIVFDGQAAGNTCTLAVGAACEAFFIIDNIFVSHTAGTTIQFDEGRYAVIRNSETEYGNLEWADAQPTVTNWGNAISTPRCHPCDVLIENNYVHDEYGEGIGTYGASVILTRGNRLANVRRVSLYTSGGRTVVEQNLVAGGVVTVESGLGDLTRTTTQNGPAFYALSFIREPATTAGEDNPEDTTTQLYRNNLVANFRNCMVSSIASTATQYRLGGRYVGNTCVGASGATSVQLGGTAALTAAEGIEVADNILVNTSGSGTCTAVTDSKATFHHNYWVGTPTDTDCRSPGTGDVYSTYEALNLGDHPFESSTELDFPTMDWFAIPATSGAAGTGEAIATTYLDPADWTWVLAQRQWRPACQAAQVPADEFVKVLTTDYCGRPHSNIGAL